MSEPKTSTVSSSRRIRNMSTSRSTGSSTPYPRPSCTSVAPSIRAGTSTGRRSRSGSAIGGGDVQKIICAISESRGVSPTVGLAFVNVSTAEAVLSQISDNQFYARTLNKLEVFEPTEILLVSSSGPSTSLPKLFIIIKENMLGVRVTTLHRKYWSEALGLEYVQQLAFEEDTEALKVAIEGNYFATCCFAATLKYLDSNLNLTFSPHSLRVKYQPSEGTMMIDIHTIRSLELIQNNQDTKSKHSLFGLLNKTLTPMGARMLRSFILQPSTLASVLSDRLDALEELSNSEDIFFQTRKALGSFQDIEKLLSSLITIPTKPDIRHSEQSINQVLILKGFVQAAILVFEALTGCTSSILSLIRQNCRPENLNVTLRLIREVINEDVGFQKTPLDLRNQRIYAVKSGVSGLLDVARQTFKEATEDIHKHATEINRIYEMVGEIRFESSRRYFFRISEDEFSQRPIPEVLVNRVHKKGYLECQTLDLIKLNQRIEDSHQEVVLMSDKTICQLLDDVRSEIPILFRVCESIAMLDVLASLCQLVTTNKFGEYVRPNFGDCIVVKSGRHPIREMAHKEKFVPNDVYADHQARFQIITGYNMSGKSTYIRSIALLSVMAQIGCYVPASHATFPLITQIFARVSMDDNNEANASTFAAEMREAAFILRNIDKTSMAFVDELGRGTSTRDGLAIALSIAEALIESQAMTWFITHFRELARILSERVGVVNLHLSVDMQGDNAMTMLYKIDKGYVQDQHYGLALARVLNLPSDVLEKAAEVAQALEALAAAKKKSSKFFALAKRRKLVLSLRDALKQAKNSPMEGQVLLSWLGKLQEEFIQRMEQIESDTAGEDRPNEVATSESVIEIEDSESED